MVLNNIKKHRMLKLSNNMTSKAIYNYYFLSFIIPADLILFQPEDKLKIFRLCYYV